MAHMKEFPGNVISPRWSVLRKFWKDIETETVSARAKFTSADIHLDRDAHDRTFWMSVITEEVGKLCRTVNKLNLKPADERIVAQWSKEGYHRIITTVSLLRRLAEVWHELPNEVKKAYVKEPNYEMNSLYDFKGEIPPWTSYCRACIRCSGDDPYTTASCYQEDTCPHYPFKQNWRPKPKEA